MEKLYAQGRDREENLKRNLYLRLFEERKTSLSQTAG